MRVVPVLIGVSAIALMVGCARLDDASPSQRADGKPTNTNLVAIRDEMRAWVAGNAIRRYAWDDPAQLVETISREDLCRRLLASHAEFEGACNVTLSECLDALENPRPRDEESLNRWAGAHRDVHRDQAKPDDAVWHRARWIGEGRYWQQDVVWEGEAPRRGWNRVDEEGLWGWDPKLPGDFKGAIDDDGQHGWKGLHVGYPFATGDACDCILWITPKEAYLECISGDGIRTGAGLGHRYQWTVVQD